MCLIILISQERLNQSKHRYYDRNPKLMTWLFGPATPPPHYDEANKPQPSQVKPFAERPSSINLPIYGGLRKQADGEVGQEKELITQGEMVQDK
jgi:hypothetical protein